MAWSVDVPGEGSSTPIIWEDRLFLITAVETEKKSEKQLDFHPETRTRPTGNVFDFIVICYNRNTGKEVWKKVVASAAPHEGRHSSTTYASASPMTDGKHLYVSFGSYGIFCMTLDGKVVWERDLGDMRTRRGWGEAVSPVVHDEKVIVMWDQEEQSEIFVLNTSDGKTAWSEKRDEPTTWATPLVVNRNNKTQIVTSGTNKVRSYDLESGKINWESDGLTLNAIPCPLMDGDNLICMSGYRGNAAYSINLAQFDPKDGNEPNEANEAKMNWRFNHDTPYVPSPLLTGGRLYFTKSLNAILTCLDSKTGEPIIKPTRLPNLRGLYASPVASRQHIYVPSREGATLVLENSPEFKVVGTNQLDSSIDASPAIVGDSIYIRTRKKLCLLYTSDAADE